MTDILLYCGDCRDLYDLVPDCAAMITDPPYRRHVHANATSAGVNGAATRKRDLGFGHLSYGLRAWIAEQANRVRAWSVIYSDSESVDVWRHSVEARGAEYIRRIPWVRWSQPQKSGDRPAQGHEMIALYHRTGARGKPLRKRWSGPGGAASIELSHELPEALDGALHHKALRATRPPEAPKHPTEKPLDQALDLVSWLTSPGDIVFDPCAGRGTTAKACALLGRGFLGSELASDEYALAEARLAELSERDLVRALRFVEAATAAGTVREPRAKFEEKTYERAQRRLRDAETVTRALGI